MRLHVRLRALALAALFCALLSAQQPGAEALTRIKVGSPVEAAAIVSQVAPDYPPLARSGNVEGVVHLAAVIGPDGAVEELHAAGGPALLFQAAVDAAKQWVYRPFLLNGNPVSVETTIDVNFELHSQPAGVSAPVTVAVFPRDTPADIYADDAYFLRRNDDVTALLVEWRYGKAANLFRAVESWGYLDFNRGVPYSSSQALDSTPSNIAPRKKL